MFQYATALSVVDALDTDFAIPRNIEITQFRNLSCKYIAEDYSNEHQFHEFDFGFDSAILQVRDNTDLSGFFQSPKYFDSHYSLLRKEFRFPESVCAAARDIVPSDKICAIHVRGGDYLERPDFHAKQPKSYYRDAIDHMKGLGFSRFVVFTDQPSDISERIDLNDNMAVHSGDTHTDLCAMVLCSAHIIANSSYSWWGAYLAESDQVIAPKRWFAENGPQCWQDVYHPEWRVI